MTPSECLDAADYSCSADHDEGVLACRDCLKAAIQRAVEEEREACAVLVEGLAQYYPVDVFIPPPPGEHGRTVDGCSAAAIRAVLPGIAHDIRSRSVDKE